MAAGAVLLVWTPASMYHVVWLDSPWPGAQTSVGSGAGIVRVMVFPSLPPSERGGFALAVGPMPPDLLYFWQGLSPWFARSKPSGAGAESYSASTLLLSAVCLAWPVTTFVVARPRRRTRGFPVEVTAP